MSEPRQKPGRSRQDYGTPPEFLQAVKDYLSIEHFAIDLACSDDNAKADNFYLDSSLDEDWTTELQGDTRWGWLNPPYGHLEPWVRKSYETAKNGGHLAVLVPAGVGANWWRDWVHRKADVLLLNGRITFHGCSAPYPKDCALLLYHPIAVALGGSYDVWTWKPAKTVDARITPVDEGKACGSARKERTYPPPFGKEEDCICPDSWRKTSPRNHTDRCASAFERTRQGRDGLGEGRADHEERRPRRP